MNEACIITTAITGSQTRKSMNPAVPITQEEQIESTCEAYEAGSSLVHLHVRNDDETSSSDPEKFARVQEGIRQHCPDMIIQFSTGGRGRDPAARGKPLYLKPDMASLATGSVNFKSSIYENEPALIDELASRMLEYQIKPEIEVFDLAMLYSAVDLLKHGLLKAPLHVQFVLGIPNALPAKRHILEFLVGELEALLPDATWVAAGVGRHQFDVADWCAELGGNIRVGLEDGVRLDKDNLAQSNAAMVRKAAALLHARNRRPATPHESREMLGLAQTD
ncbi:MAG: 3-keto-5-aminohexanoate cleavage protein [marine bacterium B5-7]|nr:MAG: 3-keto-5-aminohexanoate cleavage protein [marine bacterium B5-7]